MKYVLILIATLTYNLSFSQSISGPELLNKSIKYHDPNNNWKSFNGNLEVTMKTPKNPERNSKITINLPKEYFKVITKRDTTVTNYIMDKGKCVITKTDSLKIANLKKKPNRSHCEMAALYKDYYTYLYGLPMKLKDQGTNVAQKAERKTFKGKEYLVLNVTYNKTVGNDVWYFYFNPENYAMEIYQFFKTDDSGNLKKDSGEYILLTEETTVNNIKIPKNRAWYYNKNDEYLGTDFLLN